MHSQAHYERQEIESWACNDVNELYQSLTKVGSGTYGEVNKAIVRANPSQIVALKKIKDASETEGFPITALREIKILQQCNHPNVIKLLNVCTSKGSKSSSKDSKNSTHLVFEYMEHELLGYVETCTFNQAQVKCIIKQTIEGLAYLHQKGIIHRDIKSANILVNNRGEVKIADFGLSKFVNPQYTGKLTQRVVTRWYRAPELLLGGKTYNNKIDMWALGCVFAELLIGRSQALFPAQKTPDQFELICEKCGTPDDSQWPQYKNFPLYAKMAPRRNYARVLSQYMLKQKAIMDPFALDLLEKMLTFNPDERISAADALRHPYFQSFPPACHPSELPKIDQDCHTYIINNRRKNNNKVIENNNRQTNQPVKRASAKSRNVPVPAMQIMQPMPNMQPMQSIQPIQNLQPIQPIQPIQPVQNMQVKSTVKNTSNNTNTYQTNTMPACYQYNNYCSCPQINHIDNINNINVNLIIPATNQMNQMNQMIPQPNLYSVNFPTQTIPYYNAPTNVPVYEDINNINNLNNINNTNNNSYLQSSSLDQSMLFNTANVIPISNNPMLSNSYNSHSYFNSMPMQNNSYMNQQRNVYQYNQEPSLYSLQNYNADQYTTSNIEKSYLTAQDLCRRENSHLLAKRRTTSDLEEFEPLGKRAMFDFFQP